MKKCLLYSAIAVFFAVSCEIENDNQINQVEDDVTTITLGIDSGATKTNLQGTVNLVWSAGDELSVDTKTVGQKTFTLQGVGGTSSGVFSCPGTFSLGDACTTFYPASLAPSYHDDNWYVTLPSAIDWSEDGVKAPMYGWINKSVDPYDYMVMMTGVLKLDVYNIPATATKLVYTTQDQKVSGEFVFDSPFYLSTSADAVNKSITVSFPAGESMRSFFIPVPAGTYTAGSTIELYDDTDTRLVKRTAPALSVNAGTIKYLPAINCESAGSSSNVYSNLSGFDVANWAYTGIDYDFSGAKEGDLIKFTVTLDAKVEETTCTYWQINISNNIEGWPKLFAFDIPSGSTEYYFRLNSTVAEAMRSVTSIVLSGYGVTVSSIDIIPAAAEMVIWKGSKSCGSSGDNLLAEGLTGTAFWSSLSAGKIMTVYYTIDDSGGYISYCTNYPTWSNMSTFNPSADTNAIALKLSSDNVTAIKANGLAIQGKNVTFSKITLR